MKQCIFLISLVNIFTIIYYSYKNLSTICYGYIIAQILSKDVKIYVKII